MTEAVGVAALLAIGDLLQRPDAMPAAFPEMVSLMRTVAPFEAIGVAFWDGGHERVVRCFSATDGSGALERTEAVVTAAAAYFAEELSLDRFEALTNASRDRWISLPLTRECGSRFGLIAVEVPVAVDEQAIAFVACVARHLASGAARQRAAAEASALRDRREHDAAAALTEAHRARAAAESSAVVAELTGLVLSSFEYVGTLRQLARVLGTRLASGCAIDIEDERGTLDRIAHTPLHAEPELSRALGPLVARVMTRHRSVSVVERRKDRHRSMTSLAAYAERARVELGVDWVCSAPVTAQGCAIGAITVIGSLEQHIPLSVRLVDQLARRIGVAVENARRYGAAVAAVRAREQILATVSHDLRNPLSVIVMSAAEVLAKTPSVDRRRSGHQVEVIRRNARRMEKLVNDLLDIVSFEAGAMSLHPTRHDLTMLAREAIDDVRSIASARGVDLSTEIPSTPVFVWADADRITQVVANILANAIKFSGSPGKVTVRLWSSSSDAVSVAIRDNGCGIAEADLPHVFERFWQGDQADAVKRRGAGLGLAISKSLVEGSGGRIWIESRVGQGTTVTFTLPLPLRPAAMP